MTGRYHIVQAVHSSTRNHIPTWETRGLKIDGEYLSHLRVADDICGNTPPELQHMLQELADESEHRGLTMNLSTTKVMMENDTPIYVDNTETKNIESYINLGQINSTRDNNQHKEIQRRRFTAGRTALAKHRDIFNGKFGTCLKTQLYNSCVLPAMTYGAEIWALTTQAKNKPAASQTNGKEYVKHHIPGQKNKYIGKRKHKGYSRD